MMTINQHARAKTIREAIRATERAIALTPDDRKKMVEDGTTYQVRHILFGDGDRMAKMERIKVLGSLLERAIAYEKKPEI